MSYTRPAGWIMLPSHTGFINHYFNGNQTMGLCGAESTKNIDTQVNRIDSAPTCKRCLKYKEISELRKSKK